MCIVKIISVKTKRYSTFVRRILDEYKHIIVNIDGAVYHDKDIPYLKEFCTNKQLQTTLDFLIARDSSALFGFHDHPSEFWANISEIEFVTKLARENILRYRIFPVRPPLWRRLFNKLKNALPVLGS